MVLGYFIATGIETIIELGFWSLKKTYSALYNTVYGKTPDDNTISKSEIASLHKELQSLKELLREEKGMKIAS